MAQEKTVATPDEEIAEMSANWPMIDALMGGTSAMRAAGKQFLPKHPAEAEDAYVYRLSVSTLYNAYRRTIETLSGKPFADPIRLDDSMPEDIKVYCDDIDLAGNNLHQFSHSSLKSALTYGLTHILVDFPVVENVRTKAEEKASGARPYFVHLCAKSIIGWRSERINGVETLTMLRFYECVDEPDGDFWTKEVTQIRVIERDAWRIYRQDVDKKWFLYKEGVNTLGKIALVTVYGERCGFMEARPPLLDLAHLNVEHWQSSSDQSNILHVARVPILFAAGFGNDDKIAIGAGVACTNTDPAAKLSYVEHTGAAIGAGADSIKQLEERMSLMGAQMLVRRPGSRTATEKAIDSAEADSALSAMARDLEDAIAAALALFAEWMGQEKGGSIEVCKTFSLDIGDTAGTQSLDQARTHGALSSETLFKELQRRGIVSDDVKWEDEMKRIKAEGTTGIAGNFETLNPGGAPAA